MCFINYPNTKSFIKKKVEKNLERNNKKMPLIPEI